MKGFRLSMLLGLMLTAGLAIPLLALPLRAAESPARFFPVKDLMPVGVYYYPEHWPPQQWERDFARMEAMGFEFVHMGEFAWAMMEPEEGKFDFTWLDREIDAMQDLALTVGRRKIANFKHGHSLCSVTNSLLSDQDRLP